MSQSKSIADFPQLIKMPATQVAAASGDHLSRPRNSRLTCVLMLCHTSPNGDDPLQVDCRFGDLLESKERPYSRPLEVGEEWQEIDTYWVKEASMICIRNLKPKYDINPTKEQKEEDEKRVIELARENEKPWLIRPGRVFLAEPSDLQGLLIRSQHGIAEVHITAIPK